MMRFSVMTMPTGAHWNASSLSGFDGGAICVFYDLAGISDRPIIRTGRHRTKQKRAAFACDRGSLGQGGPAGGTRTMNLAEWLVRAATLSPSSPALLAGETVEADYRAFARRAAALGAALAKSHGVRPGDRVAILA